MDPVIETTTSNGCGWLKVSGWMSMRMGPALSTCLGALAHAGAAEIRVDLHACEHIDSTIMGCLVGFVQRRSANGGPALVLNRCSDACRAALRQMKLDAFLTLDDATPPGAGWQVLDAHAPSTEALAAAVVAAHQDLAQQNPEDAKLAKLAQALADSDGKRQT